jgi:hypothetical protein
MVENPLPVKPLSTFSLFPRSPGMPSAPRRRRALAGLRALAAASPTLAEWRGLPWNADRAGAMVDLGTDLEGVEPKLQPFT